MSDNEVIDNFELKVSYNFLRSALEKEILNYLRFKYGIKHSEFKVYNELEKIKEIIKNKLPILPKINIDVVTVDGELKEIKLHDERKDYIGI